MMEAISQPPSFHRWHYIFSVLQSSMFQITSLKQISSFPRETDTQARLAETQLLRLTNKQVTLLHYCQK